MKQLFAGVMLAFSLPLLASCGFTPLYASAGISSGLSGISVEAPDGRTAYLLRERLDDSLGRDRRVLPTHRLSYTLLETRDPRGLGADNAASRYELNLTVDYTLVRIADGQTVRTGQEKVLIIYEAVSEPYAGVAAQQDGQERAAAEAARRIRLELAEYFASGRG